jgi:hypothetical protein
MDINKIYHHPIEIFFFDFTTILISFWFGANIINSNHYYFKFFFSLSFYMLFSISLFFFKCFYIYMDIFIATPKKMLLITLPNQSFMCNICHMFIYKFMFMESILLKLMDYACCCLILTSVA